jgi:hypothetical protein
MKNRLTMTGASVTRRDRLILCGAVAPVIKGLGIAVASALYPGYSHVSQALSELSTPDSPSALIARANSVVFGLLQLGFAIALLRRKKVPLALTVLLTSIAAFGGSIFTGSPGLPLPGQSGFTPGDALHNSFGLLGGMALVAEPLVGAIQMRGEKGFRSVSWVFAALTGITGAVALGGIGSSQKGLWQRAFQLCSHSWQIAAALRLRRVRRSVGDESRP